MILKNIFNFSSFFGHPWGLASLFSTELWERFSFYGMKAILLYYLYHSVSDGGLGLPQAMSVSIVAIFGSLIYGSSLLGGWISDRILGPYKSVAVGSILILGGHLTLSLPLALTGLIIAFFLLITGTGLLKSNVSTMVGMLYDNYDSNPNGNFKSRDAGYAIFYLGINIGGFISPILVGYISNFFGYHAGFSLCIIGMMIALICFIHGRKRLLPKDAFNTPNPLTKEQMKCKLIYILCLIAFIPGIVYCLNLNQIILLLTVIFCIVPTIWLVILFKQLKQSNDKLGIVKLKGFIPVFIGVFLWCIMQDQTQTNLAWLFDTGTDLHGIPAALMQSVNPLSIIILSPILAWFYKKKITESSTKFTAGLIITIFCAVFLSLLFVYSNGGGLINGYWLILYLITLSIAELLVFPIGLSLTTQVTSQNFQSQLMGIFLLSDSIAGGVIALTVNLYKAYSVSYFLVIGIAIAIFTVFFVYFENNVNKELALIEQK